MIVMSRFFRSFRRLHVLGLAAGLVVLALIPVAIAQSRRPPAALQQAQRAFIEGRYDEVIAAADRLDPQDANAATLKARALIARGRYQDAETLLRPLTQKSPTSDA